jgi:hypothetical protein
MIIIAKRLDVEMPEIGLVIHVDFLSLKTGFYHHDYFSFNDGNNS